MAYRSRETVWESLTATPARTGGLLAVGSMIAGLSCMIVDRLSEQVPTLPALSSQQLAAVLSVDKQAQVTCEKNGPQALEDWLPTRAPQFEAVGLTDRSRQICAGGYLGGRLRSDEVAFSDGYLVPPSEGFLAPRWVFKGDRELGGGNREACFENDSLLRPSYTGCVRYTPSEDILATIDSNPQNMKPSDLINTQ